MKLFNFLVQMRNYYTGMSDGPILEVWKGLYLRK